MGTDVRATNHTEYESGRGAPATAKGNLNAVLAKLDAQTSCIVATLGPFEFDIEVRVPPQLSRGAVRVGKLAVYFRETMMATHDDIQAVIQRATQSLLELVDGSLLDRLTELYGLPPRLVKDEFVEGDVEYRKRLAALDPNEQR